MVVRHGKVTLELLKEKAVWWEKYRILCLADLHFGKAHHFRKSGIPIPEPVHEADIQKLEFLFLTYKPDQVLFLGDLFHSDWNPAWTELIDFLKTFPTISFRLILGNHDILSEDAYVHSPIERIVRPLVINSLILSHEPLEKVDPGMLNICGHIHPGVLLRGNARQRLRIPCFFKSSNQLILPAFGEFTGLSILRPGKKTELFGVTPSKVIPILS